MSRRPAVRASVLAASAAVLLAATALTACTHHARTRSPTSTRHAEAAVTGCGRPAPARPGSDRQYTLPIAPALANGADERTALVHVPTGYRGTAPIPLVLQFHGAGPHASAAGYEHSSPLHRFSDVDEFLDVFPQALRAPNGNLAWNAYGPVYVKIAEIPFINKLLDTLEHDFCIDPHHIYASGVSNGANMVNYLACRDAARIAAIAPVVGPMFGQDDGPCRPTRPVPIIDIHALNDPIAPYGGYPGPPANQFALPSVPAWLNSWVQLDGCTPARPAQRGPGGVSSRAWTTCRDGARITAYATHAGHSWPPTIDGQPAAQRVWAFLSGFRTR